MAGRSAVLSVRIVGDGTGAQKTLKQTESAAADFGGTMDRVASTAAFAKITTGLLDLGKASYDAASDAEQNLGAVETVFGSAADSIISKSQGAADAVGMSASSYDQLAASIGGSMRSAVKDQDELSTKTQELISAGADLSSVFGGTAAEAVDAMGAALRGEFDPLEQFGVFLNMNAVNAELAATGQDKLTGAALDAAKKQAIQNLIMKQASDYTGNFAKESDTAAGAQQRAAAQWEDAKAKLGSALLPAMVTASRVAAALASAIGDNSAVITPLLLVVGALTAGIIGYNLAMAALPALQAAAAAAQWLLNAAMSANPVGIIIIALVALVGVFILLWNKCAWFRDGLTTAFNWIVNAGKAMGAWFASLPATIKVIFNRFVWIVGESAIAVGTWFRSLPGRILGALGNVGALLLRAGASIIQGFLNGLLSAWHNVTSFVSGIGPWIAAHKGPISYDRTLLTPAGAAIMGGFNDALADGMRDTRSLVGDVNGLVGGIGSGIRPTPGTVNGGLGAGATIVNVTVNGALDPTAVGEQLQRVLDTYFRGQGRTRTTLTGVTY